MTEAPSRAGSGRRVRVRALVPCVLLRLLAPAILATALLAMAAPVAAESDSLKVGVLATLEGAFAPLGQDALRGYELAVEEHEGSAGGLRIEALTESTDGTTDSVIAKALMLIERGASIIIGPLAGIESIAIRELAKSVPEVTFINGAAAAQEATLHAPAGNFFRFNPDSMQWIAGLGRYAYEEKGLRTIVAVVEDYSLPYTQLLGFMLDYCALGGQVLDRHWVSPGTSDAVRIAETVAHTEADALFLALAPRVAENFLEAYGEAGGEAAIVASSTTLNGGLLKANDAIRPLLLGAIAALPVSESEDNEAWAALTQRYRERFPDAGPTPSLFALAYYVNTKALLLALEKTGGDPGEGHGRLRAALAGLSFETPFGGPVSLDANRHAVTSTFIVEVAEAEDGSLVQRTVHVVPKVTQTLGWPREAFLALGPPNRHTPHCAEGAVSLAEAAPPRTEATLDTPGDQPPPEGQEDNATPETAREAPGGHPLFKSDEDAEMTEIAPAIYPCLTYRDAPAAIAWLKEAFGFTETMVVPGPDGTIAHAQLAFGGGMIMVGSQRDDALALGSPCDLGGNTQSIYVVVENADAHYARAVLSGAEIVRDLEDTDYGSRDYSARDPEGHLWHFGTYRPEISK